MKRIFTTLALLLTVTLGFSQTNVANGQLENWISINSVNGTYMDLPGPFLKSLDTLYTLPQVIGGPGPITAERVTDACEGTYAAKLTSKSFQGIFIPGAIGTMAVTIAPPNAKLGKPYTDRPNFVKYCAKYSPVAGDSAEVFCLLSKWNGSSRDTIAYGNLKHLSAVGSYTEYTFPLVYQSTEAPDTAVLVAVASAGYNFTNLTQSAGQVNSALFVDNLRFDFTTSVNDAAVAKPEVKLYPSPVTDVLNIAVTNATATGYRIIDLAGRTVLSGTLQGANSEVIVSKLAPGTYWVQVAGAKGILSTKQIHKQ